MSVTTGRNPNMGSKYADLLKEIEHERHGSVEVFWFPRDFSQSRLGDRSTGSNACTLIALLVAQRWYEEEVKIVTSEGSHLSNQVIKVLSDSIVEGNEIHERMLRKGELHHVNMTVPEAIDAAGVKMKFISEWKSLVYLLDLGESLYEQLYETVLEWYHNPPPRKGSDLYVILIAENRSVLLIFQKVQGKVTLIDSHQHLNRGAVVAQVSTDRLQSLCQWYYNLLLTYYGARPECYELSYLYFKRFEAGELVTG